MVAAANDIDAKLGLPRFDAAITLAAEIIAAHYEASAGRGGRNLVRKHDDHRST